jgi:hypothetical protein
MAQLCGPLDLQNDALASSDELVDDAVLLERLDTRLERRRKTWFRSLLGAYVVVAGLIVTFGWIYGAPDHLRLAIDRWWGGADLLTALPLLAGEASGNGNISFVDFMLGSMMPFLVLPWITLIFGLTLYGIHKHGKRYQERVRLAGFHACPLCGADTRTDKPNCRLCRQIDSARVPPFWRAFIELDPAFEKHGSPSHGRTSLKGRFLQSNPANGSRNRVRQLALCSVAILTLSGALFFDHFFLQAILFINCLQCISAMYFQTEFNRFSTHGFCPECKYEQLPDAPAATCQECGCRLTEGCLIYGYREQHASERVISLFFLLIIALIFADSFSGGLVLGPVFGVFI